MDDRSAMAQAFAWSSRITTISLEMALPGAAGHWIDGKLGTAPVCLIVGAALGMIAGMSHLLHLAKTGTSGKSDETISGTRSPADRTTVGKELKAEDLANRPPS